MRQQQPFLRVQNSKKHSIKKLTQHRFLLQDIQGNATGAYNSGHLWQFPPSLSSNLSSLPDASLEPWDASVWIGRRWECLHNWLPSNPLPSHFSLPHFPQTCFSVQLLCPIRIAFCFPDEALNLFLPLTGAFPVLGDGPKSSSHHISYSGHFQLAFFLLSSVLVSELALPSLPTF